MTDTPTTTKTITAQQWAWEFLQRNTDYLDAFQKLAALSPEQFVFITVLEEEVQQIDEVSIRSLDLEFFEMNSMTGYQDSQKTVGEYFDQSQKQRDSLYEFDVSLQVAKAFRSTTYSLTRWCVPNTKLTASEAASIWHHEVSLELGLVTAPKADGMLTDFETRMEMHKSGLAFTMSADEVASLKVDKRVRKSPIHSSVGMVEVFRGVDGRTYMRNRSLQKRLERQQVNATFDLRFPIEYQINQIKSVLEQHQNALVQSGFIKSLSKQADKFGNYAEYLKILDLLKEGKSHLDIAIELDGLTTKKSSARDVKTNKIKSISKVVNHSKPLASTNELTQAVRKKIARAIHLRDHGYRALAFST
jgi:hypothetical protein